MSQAKAIDSCSKIEPLPHLLIVEDDASTCNLIGKIAEKIGFSTSAASSLEEAAKLLRNSLYQCITLDLMLGKSSAVALYRTLVETAPATPIVIITGSADWTRHAAVSLGKAARLNVVASMTKPMDLGDLRVVLTSVREFCLGC